MNGTNVMLFDGWVFIFSVEMDSDYTFISVNDGLKAKDFFLKTSLLLFI